MTKASAGRNERRGKVPDAIAEAYQSGYADGINFLGMRLAEPAGVLMKDGRIARIVYDPAPGTAITRDDTA
jgi:hypothetical protein